MKKTLLWAAAASGLLMSGGAFAQAYLGFSAGATKLGDNCAGTLTCDTKDSGGKLFGGYKFTPNLGAELVYLDFGKGRASAAVGGGVVNLDIKTRALGGGLMATGQLGSSWTGTARLGVAQVKVDASGTFQGQPASANDHTTQAYLGLSLGYLLTQNVSLDLAYDHTSAKFQGSTDNVDMLSLGLTCSF